MKLSYIKSMVSFREHASDNIKSIDLIIMMGLVERCLDLSKEFFSYRSKGWEFMPDQV